MGLRDIQNLATAMPTAAPSCAPSCDGGWDAPGSLQQRVRAERAVCAGSTFAVMHVLACC